MSKTMGSDGNVSVRFKPEQQEVAQEGTQDGTKRAQNVCDCQSINLYQRPWPYNCQSLWSLENPRASYSLHPNNPSPFGTQNHRPFARFLVAVRGVRRVRSAGHGVENRRNRRIGVAKRKRE